MLSWSLMFLVIALPCFMTLPVSLDLYQRQYQINGVNNERPPSLSGYEASPRTNPPLEELRMSSFQESFFPMGTDTLERNLFWRVLLGGAISLGIGLAAALISVTIGVAYGATSGLLGGRVDTVMMRIVDVLYGLPYILLVVLVNIALQPFVERLASAVLSPDMAKPVGEVVTLLVAIGGVSWLTMARVIRGQVLSLREQPFIESAHAIGASTPRILIRHLLPNLMGPIIVYATLTVPQAILQESFLSFLGIGVQAPLPSWGNLASNGLPELTRLGDTPIASTYWWLLFFPCLLLGVTLMALNFMGDALRNHFDPKTRQR